MSRLLAVMMLFFCAVSSAQNREREVLKPRPPKPINSDWMYQKSKLQIVFPDIDYVNEIFTNDGQSFFETLSDFTETEITFLQLFQEKCEKVKGLDSGLLFPNGTFIFSYNFLLKDKKSSVKRFFIIPNENEDTTYYIMLNVKELHYLNVFCESQYFFDETVGNEKNGYIPNDPKPLAGFDVKNNPVKVLMRLDPFGITQSMVEKELYRRSSVKKQQKVSKKNGILRK